MKTKLPWIVIFVLATVAQASSLDSGTPVSSALQPEERQAQAAHLAAELLTRYHYKALPLDDAMSEKIFDRYLKALDTEKFLFVQADIDQMAGFRTKLDDAIVEEDLAIPFAIFNRYVQRAAERFTYARSLLAGGFDFGKNEDFQYAREKEAWPKSEEEIRDLWRKRVKNDWLRLKLAGKDDKGVVDILDKRYENTLKHIGRLTSEDAFETFMNAYTMAIEPHTNYMGPRAAEDFDISMKLSLVGIGVALAEKDDYFTILDMVPGGPAFLSGQIKIGDRIVGVAQGKDGAMTDILGWRLEDAVALIRGAADSVVVLDVLPVGAGPDGLHKMVALTRKKITLEDQAAKKSILAMTEGKVVRRIGVITLPTFYEDFDAQQKGDQDFKSATRDVARLLAELKKEKVDGVLMDLRNNSGGSLLEAIELSGLFVGNGPVVQERDAHGKLNVDEDAHAHVAWDGPLGVLINHGTASAAEIFAAAVQDYRRGLVIGEQSFGKGTVQTMVNLDQIAKNDKPQYGELKLTVAQFFRVNGDTTQLHGVTPDILFPSVSDPNSFGESSFDNALPWMRVKAAEYAPAGGFAHLLPMLRKRHEARVKKDRDFQHLQDDIAELKAQRQKNAVSLNEAVRRAESDVQKTRRSVDAKPAESGRGDGKGGVGKMPASTSNSVIGDDGLQADERILVTGMTPDKPAKDAKDIFLNEAGHILGDEVGLLRSAARLTTHVEAAFSLIRPTLSGGP